MCVCMRVCVREGDAEVRVLSSWPAGVSRQEGLCQKPPLPSWRSHDQLAPARTLSPCRRLVSSGSLQALLMGRDVFGDSHPVLIQLHMFKHEACSFPVRSLGLHLL